MGVSSFQLLKGNRTVSANLLFYGYTSKSGAMSHIAINLPLGIVTSMHDNFCPPLAKVPATCLSERAQKRSNPKKHDWFFMVFLYCGRKNHVACCSFNHRAATRALAQSLHILWQLATDSSLQCSLAEIEKT